MSAKKSPSTGQKQQSSKDQAKDTGMAMVLICLIYLYFVKDIDGALLPAILLLLNMTIPAIYTLPAKLWFGLSHVMGSVMTRVLLSLLFFLMVVPVALIRRILGKDTMALRRFKDGSVSAFVTRDHGFVAADLEKPF